MKAKLFALSLVAASMIGGIAHAQGYKDSPEYQNVRDCVSASFQGGTANSAADLIKNCAADPQHLKPNEIKAFEEVGDVNPSVFSAPPAASNTHTSDKVPFDAQVRTHDYNPAYPGTVMRDTVIFTATDDQETIQGIVINRGNCKSYPKLPATLKYGQTYSFVAPVGCNVREVILQTNSGSYTFTWHN